MGINLQKGQKINLSKDAGAGALSKIRVGLGWDPVRPEKATGGFFKKMFAAAAAGPDIDCDASVLMLNDKGVLAAGKDTIYFGNLKSRDGSVVHQGDNLTGEGEGDDEVVVINLPKVGDAYHRLVFVVNIYNAKSKGQHFGMIQNAYIRVVDDSSGKELCKYALTEDHADMTALTVGELEREGGEWKFAAIGDASKDGGLKDMIRRYGG